MKYIRTKEEIILNPAPLDCGKYEFGTYMGKDAKQADTIEELCDTFVVKGDNWHQEIGLEDAKWNAKQKLDVYGAIWTDNSLIYVAKMNEEGVLCLI